MPELERPAGIFMDLLRRLRGPCAKSRKRGLRLPTGLQLQQPADLLQREDLLASYNEETKTTARKQTGSFYTPRPIEKEIEQGYHSHFSIQRRDQKIALQKRIKTLRQKLSDTLIDGLGANKNSDIAKKAQLLADWDAFDPQASADFFDPHWMFGRSLDSYSLFVERSARLLQANGVLSYILPDTWLTLIHGEKFCRWLLERYEIAELDLLNGLVFHGVVVDTMLLFIIRKKPSSISQTKVICAKKDERITNVSELPISATYNQLGWLKEPQARIKVFAVPEFDSILSKARNHSVSVDSLIEYRAGCKPYEVGKGAPPQTKEVMASKPFTKSINQGRDWMPLLRGNDIQRYAVNSKKPEWIHYGVWLAAMRSMAVFSGPRILIQVVRNPPEKSSEP